MTRDEIEEKYGWQPGEREALEADMAARKARLSREETLRWCQEQNEKKHAAEQAERDELNQSEPTMSTGSTQIWESWIRDQVKKSQLAADNTMIGAMADLLAPIRKNADKVNSEIATLHAEIAALREQIAELRGEWRGRVAAEAEARQVPSRLKTVG